MTSGCIRTTDGPELSTANCNGPFSEGILRALAPCQHRSVRVRLAYGRGRVYGEAYQDAKHGTLAKGQGGVRWL